MCFPDGSEVKASAFSAGDPGLIPGSGRSPGEGNSNPLQYSCLYSRLQRSLAGYSSQGRKESDTTEPLHFTSTGVKLGLTRSIEMGCGENVSGEKTSVC